MKKQYIQPATALLVANLHNSLMAASNPQPNPDEYHGGGTDGSGDQGGGTMGSGTDAGDFSGGAEAKYNVWNEWDD